MSRLSARVHDVENNVPDDATVPLPAPKGPAAVPTGHANYTGVNAMEPEPRAPIPAADAPRDDARR